MIGENLVCVYNIEDLDRNALLYKGIKLHRETLVPELIDICNDFWKYWDSRPNIKVVCDNLVCEPCQKCFKIKQKTTKSLKFSPMKKMVQIYCHCDGLNCHKEMEFWSLTLWLFKATGCYELALNGINYCKMCQQDAKINKEVVLANEDPVNVQREIANIKALNDFKPTRENMKRNVYKPLRKFKICNDQKLIKE